MKLPDILRDLIKGVSTAVECTAFTEYHQTKLGYWDWLEEDVQLPDGSIGKRPDLANFALGMSSAGQVMGAPLYYGERVNSDTLVRHLELIILDFPWASLGEATVVDVGGGIGQCGLHQSSVHTQL